MKKLKCFFLMLLVFSVALSPLVSERFYITENQLQTLENESTKQKELIQNLETQLKEASLSLKKSESKNFKEKIIIGAACSMAGLATGACVGFIITK